MVIPQSLVINSPSIICIFKFLIHTWGEDSLIPLIESEYTSACYTAIHPLSVHAIISPYPLEKASWLLHLLQQSIILSGLHWWGTRYTRCGVSEKTGISTLTLGVARLYDVVNIHIHVAACHWGATSERQRLLYRWRLHFCRGMEFTLFFSPSNKDMQCPICRSTSTSERGVILKNQMAIWISFTRGWACPNSLLYICSASHLPYESLVPQPSPLFPPPKSWHQEKRLDHS